MFLDPKTDLPNIKPNDKVSWKNWIVNNYWLIFFQVCICAEKAEADVRMIDFANTTFRKDTDDKMAMVHNGPDAGFLLGLDSLLRIFTEILDEHWTLHL